MDLFQEKKLVDMCCTNSEVWAIWEESDGGECVKHLTYDGCVTLLLSSALSLLCSSIHSVVG